MYGPLPSIVGDFPGILQSRVKGIDGSYKLSELLFGRGGSADVVVNVATVEFRFGAVVLTKKPTKNCLRLITCTSTLNILNTTKVIAYQANDWTKVYFFFYLDNYFTLKPILCSIGLYGHENSVNDLALRMVNALPINHRPYKIVMPKESDLSVANWR